MTEFMPPHQPIRVLYLAKPGSEDCSWARLIAKEPCAIQVKTVTSGAEFVEQAHGGEYEVVVAEYGAGNMQPDDVLCIATQQAIARPVIFVSGEVEVEMMADAYQKGATDWLNQSNPEKFGPAIQRADKVLRKREEIARLIQSLRTSEKRFTQLSEHVGNWIWEVDVEGVFIYSNNVVQKVLGWSAQEIVGQKHFHDFYPEEKRGEIIRLVSENFANRLPYTQFRHPMTHRSGKVLLIETSATPIYDPNDMMLGSRGISSDVTEQQQVEERLRQQATLLDHAQDAIIARDLQGIILYWNNGAERLYGWSSKEAVGHNWAELMRSDKPDDLITPLENVIKNGQWLGELRYVNRTGQVVTVQSRLTLIRDNTQRQPTILVVDTDISDRKKMEAELLRVQRLESIGRLAGGVAHDLNNVLTPILMSAQLLRAEARTPSMNRFLDTIEASAQRGASIVKQVLAFARGIEGEKGALQPRLLVQEMAKIIRETFPKSIQLHCQMGEDIWLVNGNATHLHQVLMNLCVNARDAMPEGGFLVLTTENVVLDDISVQPMPGAHPGRYVVLGVSDTGTGISQDIMDNIFDPFFTTKTPDKGTGLGLSTVMGIVKDHKGFVRVSSKLGKGSQFKIYLPAVGASDTSQSAPPTAEIPTGNGELILVVDDELHLREVASKMVERFGYRSLIACDGTEGVALYAQNSAQIGLVLTDLAMPFMDGPSMIRAIRRLSPDLPIIAMSGLDSFSQDIDFNSLNVSDFIRKPFSARSLMESIHQALHGKNPSPRKSDA